MERFPADIRNELANYTTGVWFQAKRMAMFDVILKDVIIYEPYEPTTVIPRLESDVDGLIDATRYGFEIYNGRVYVSLMVPGEPKTITVFEEDGEKVVYSPVVHEIFRKKILHAISDLFPDVMLNA